MPSARNSSCKNHFKLYVNVALRFMVVGQIIVEENLLLALAVTDQRRQVNCWLTS